MSIYESLHSHDVNWFISLQGEKPTQHQVRVPITKLTALKKKNKSLKLKLQADVLKLMPIFTCFGGRMGLESVTIIYWSPFAHGVFFALGFLVSTFVRCGEAQRMRTSDLKHAPFPSLRSRCDCEEFEGSLTVSPLCKSARWSCAAFLLMGWLKGAFGCCKIQDISRWKCLVGLHEAGTIKAWILKAEQMKERFLCRPRQQSSALCVFVLFCFFKLKMIKCYKWLRSFGNIISNNVKSWMCDWLTHQKTRMRRDDHTYETTAPLWGSKVRYVIIKYGSALYVPNIFAFRNWNHVNSARDNIKERTC